MKLDLILTLALGLTVTNVTSVVNRLYRPHKPLGLATKNSFTRHDSIHELRLKNRPFTQNNEGESKSRESGSKESPSPRFSPGPIITYEVEVDVPSRPKSPVKQSQWSPVYTSLGQDKPKLDKFPWVYCPNETFVSGVTYMHSFKKEVTWDMRLIRMTCTTLGGLHYSDIYMGSGDAGNYVAKRTCSGTLAQGLTVDVHPDQCHPGVVEIGICDSSEINKRSHHLQCPPFTAICGLSGTNDNYTYEQIQSYYYSYCSNDIYEYAPINSFNQIGIACCRVNNPAEDCKAAVKYKFLVQCARPNITCLYSLKTSFGFTETNSQATKYHQTLSVAFGFTSEKNFGIYKASVSAKIGYSKVYETTVDDILATATVNEEHIIIDLKDCYGSLYQVLLTCGIYEARTKVYECVEINKKPGEL